MLVSYGHRDLFAFHPTSLLVPLDFSLSMPLHKPYVTEHGRVYGMGFKDVLVWLRRHLAEIVFLLIALVLLALIGYWTWAATPQAEDFFEQRALKKELAADMDTFYAAVRNGRDQAMADPQRMGVEVTPEGWRIYADTGGWGDGWIVFVDVDRGCDYDAGTEVILRASGGPQGDIAMTGAPGCLGFTPSGYTASNATEAFTLCNSSAGKSRVTTVEGVGHIRTTTGTCS
jgi:Tfp pilus assembly protein FimT